MRHQATDHRPTIERPMRAVTTVFSSIPASAPHWADTFSSWPGRHQWECTAFALTMMLVNNSVWSIDNGWKSFKAAFILILMGIWPPSTCNDHLWGWRHSLLQWGIEILGLARHPLGLSSVWFCYGYSPDGDEPLASPGYSRPLGSYTAAPCSNCNLAKSGWMDAKRQRLLSENFANHTQDSDTYVSGFRYGLKDREN